MDSFDPYSNLPKATNRRLRNRSASSLGSNKPLFDKRLVEISEAKEFQSYLRLPKYNHVSMAVIHPSAAPVVRRHTTSVPNLLVGGHTAVFKPKSRERQELPEHLIKGTLTRNASSTSVKRPTTSRVASLSKENKKPIVNNRVKVVQSNKK